MYAVKILLQKKRLGFTLVLCLTVVNDIAIICLTKFVSKWSNAISSCLYTMYTIYGSPLLYFAGQSSKAVQLQLNFARQKITSSL